MLPVHLVRTFANLQKPGLRVQTASELAQLLQVDELLIFGKDADIDVFLPAPGFPQTRANGRAWKALLNRCAEAGQLSGVHPERTGVQVFALCDEFRDCILVFVGRRPDPEYLPWLEALMPLLGAKLVDERCSMIARGNAMAARSASKKADELNHTLDRSRMELERAIQRAEQELRSRREAEEQLREAGRRKDEFLAMLAHELRNPLAPISAAAELLKISGNDVRRIAQVSTVIARQVNHMTELIDDLLDVSRVTRGIITLQNETVNVRELVSDAIEQVGSLVQERHHELKLQVADSELCVHGDRTRLVQVFSNLINNAAKYTPPGGLIEVKLSGSEATVELTVRDNGIGITPQLLPYIFDLFTQAERSQDRAQGGLGLGLALARSLVDLHGGTLVAASDGSRKGSEFTVRLPRQHAGERSGKSSRSVEPDEAAHGKLRILVVDDNVDAAQMLALFLQAAGHELSVVHSSAEGLLRAPGFAPDVCMIDIGLPEMDGNELARRLRALDKTSGATLIAVTGYGQPHDRANALQAGFDAHFVKPLDMAELAKLLNKLQRC